MYYKRTNAVIISLLAAFLSCQSLQAGGEEFREKGIAAYKAKKYKVAAEFLEKALASGDGSPDCYIYLAGSHYGSGNYLEAVRRYIDTKNAFKGLPAGIQAESILKRIDPKGAWAARVSQYKSRNKFKDRPNPLTKENPRKPSSKAEKYLAKLPDKAEVRFTPGDHGHMLVTAYVNNQPIECMFDTGASGFFSVNDCNRLKIKPPSPSDKPDGVTRGWAGKPVPVWKREAKVKIGNLERVIPIRVSPGWDKQPLIGQEFIRDYEYSIDSKGKLMTLYKKTSNSPSKTRKFHSLYDIPCVVAHDREFVSVKLNGVTCSNVLVDTGAANTIISAGDAMLCHLNVPAGAPKYNFSGVGGDLEVQKVWVDIQMGPIRKTDFPIFVGGNSGSAIGQDFMSGWRFSVDREAKLLRFFH